MTGPFFEAHGARRPSVASTYGSCSTTSARVASRATRTCSSKLEATKIVWAPMLPVQPLKGEFRRPDLRNHRKILVVDGRVGFTGSQNLTEPGYNKPKNHKLGREWVELMTRVEGPVVRQLNVVFATDWYAETGRGPRGHARAGRPPLPPRDRGRSPGSAPRSFRAARASRPRTTCGSSTACSTPPKRRLSLTSPYFVPDESLLYAVTTAAQRGVEVELFVSADRRPVHGRTTRSAPTTTRCSTAGVRIWLYPGAVRPARQALHGRRHAGGDRVQQHGHAVLRPQLRGGPDAHRGRGRAAGSARSRTSTAACRPSSPWRSGASARWGAKYVDNVMRLTAALQ